MALAPLGTWERDVLRQDAMVNWHQTQEIGRAAEMMLLKPNQITACSMAVLAESEARRVIASNVDRAICEWTERFRDADQLNEPVAVMASANQYELLRILQLSLGHFCAIGTNDVGTTLGLAIAAQPIVAIIDAELELGNGVDTALTLPIYAPSTRILVLTDDPERAADLRIVGLDTEHRDVSDGTLRAWIEDKAA